MTTALEIDSPIIVRRSGVHGLGVFATAPIKRETRIIEYTGQRIPWASVPDEEDDPRTYYFSILDGLTVIDPSVDGNEARWINHSCQPNCEAVEEDDGRVFIEALRNIKPGEELFYDYQLQVDERTPQIDRECACQCGSPKCRGTMLAAD